jgi:hypothetical protein
VLLNLAEESEKQCDGITVCGEADNIDTDGLRLLAKHMRLMAANMRAHNAPTPCDGSCADWDSECGGGCDE